MTGYTAWYDPNKGYGFVTGEDGNDYFAHQKNILAEGFRKLIAGKEVEFVPCTENGRRVAEKIELLE